MEEMLISAVMPIMSAVSAISQLILLPLKWEQLAKHMLSSTSPHGTVGVLTAVRHT